MENEQENQSNGAKRTDDGCRAQGSIEIMIVIGALLVVLAIFAPLIRNIGNLADFALKEKLQEFAFEKIAGVLEESCAFGKNNGIKFSVVVAADTAVKYDEERFAFAYALQNQERKLELKINCDVEIAKPGIKRGAHEFFVKFDANRVILEPLPEKS